MVTPLLSICIPTHNRARQLDNLLSQISEALSFSQDGEIQVTVADNASEDHTSDVLGRWAVKQPTWHFQSHETNLGMMGNFFWLITHATGEYTWLIGDDDILVKLEALPEVLRSLRESRPSLLVLLDDFGSENGEDQLKFPKLRDFLEFIIEQNSFALIEHTWIPANIFRRRSFDWDVANCAKSSWYKHMFGLMSGVQTQGGQVIIQKNHFVRPATKAGYRERSFPGRRELELEWTNYLDYLFGLERLSWPNRVPFRQRHVKWLARFGDWLSSARRQVDHWIQNRGWLG